MSDHRNAFYRNDRPQFQHKWLNWVMEELDLHRPDRAVLAFMQAIHRLEQRRVEIGEDVARELLVIVEEQMYRDFAARKAQDRRTPSFVYFVRWGDRIKIGVAVDPAVRVRSLALPESAIELVIPGDRQTERLLHHKFRATRIPTTEWFIVSDDLERFISEARSRVST